MKSKYEELRLELASEEQKVFWSGMKDHEYNAQSSAKAVIRLSGKYIGGNVLDVGAGDGTLGRELGGVVSIDIAPASQDVFDGNITALRFGNDTFDTVFCLDVLEHLTLQDAKKAIAEIGRVLKVGGCLVITGPHRENLASNTLTCPFCKESFHKNGHQQIVSMLWLRTLLVGFSIRKVKICNLGFMQLFGLPARLFYILGLEKIFKHKLLTKNIYVVVQKRSDYGVDAC